MIRTILAAILIIFFFIVTIPVLFILWIIGLINMKVHDVISYGIMKIAFSIILFVCGAKVSVEGIDNIPKDKPVLYVGNHRSYFDIIVLYRYVVGPTGFIAKKEFRKVPVLGHWISCLHGIFLDRKDIKAGLKTILEAESLKDCQILLLLSCKPSFISERLLSILTVQVWIASSLPLISSNLPITTSRLSTGTD